jgi:hypothetical protein
MPESAVRLVIHTARIKTSCSSPKNNPGGCARVLLIVNVFHAQFDYSSLEDMMIAIAVPALFCCQCCCADGGCLQRLFVTIFMQLWM